MRIFRRLAIHLGLLGMLTSIAGCAVESIPYPKLSTVTKLKNKILSREEQDEVIRELAAEQQQLQATSSRETQKTQ